MNKSIVTKTSANSLAVVSAILTASVSKTSIYGRSLSRTGYFEVNAYLDNGTNEDENGNGQ